ncbi:glycosyltransferase family 1 protein [Robertmurraya yapensis]|uniref:Glycosyltransferase family 1 protein n=2 Tax=Bacillaceae TaxID=186817 RepID=A0A3S0RJM8_9BACI|nr:glycosyltransferase family 1 protein [Bacillus yapensis]RTR30020.1 glycosyltransferase family 1 protein [Bacillus yapensis]TKS95101.1 glycosyltransferase [Bacillus yapensis]
MGSPLRVLHAVVNMNRGGAETLIMNLYRNIDRTKVQFDFLTCKEGEFDDEIKKLGGRIHRIPYVSEVGHFKYVKALKQFFEKNNQYRIIHSHMDKMSGLILRTAKKSRIPIRISHSHNTESEGGVATKFYKWLAGRAIHSSATNFFACSEDAAKWLFANNYGSTTILKNGIDVEKFLFSLDVRKQVRDEFKIDEYASVFGHVGRFAHQKNHSFLIDVFKEVSDELKNSKLILVGDGPLRIEMENKVKTLKLDNNVIFTGVRKDINRILQAFDYFVFPSMHEGLPVSLIEAQGAGLPCLISDNISSEVDIGIGLVHPLPLKDKYSWVRKVKELNENKKSRLIEVDKIAESGYEIKSTADYIEDYYLDTLEWIG